MVVTTCRCVVLAAALVFAVGCEREGRQRADTETVAGTVPAAVIVEPAHDAHLPVPDVLVRLAAEHITLAPAGTQEPNTGHLHLFINRDLTPPGEPIPQGEGIVHLGKAQTEHALLGLAPGDYTVIAVIGDWAHVRIADAVTDTVRFTVGE